MHLKLSQYFFQRRENEMAEFTLRTSAITPFLIFSAVKFAASTDALATIEKHPAGMQLREGQKNSREKRG